ncbi:3-hydroxyacyl-CoA dehydrogenase NAD-binding domain-containing protein [Futiania mangrovi]|uniref:3-hydroxyacyl-CoA dehydrogenase NAD-binding domain-containing protein n=1 Tax=Futiania mangrovi TaxID=2959716 RepID=A0A9J6PJD5_9PROT|nr:3-hydroxyacyl-CoA dehydrogenase NAD-binding domain-containing protein [Futiania mangrovii]MCP1336186.1 3-hydroxyacyl-CoA dehydrogenase NAD-binding domain-containing protein [Futiania mangrovii]
MSFEQLRYDVDADGIATIAFDMPGRSMNVLSEDSIREYEEAIDKALADDAVVGVVVTSGKDSFMAGADLSMLERQAKDAANLPKEARAQAVFDFTMGLHRMMRKLEAGGKPVASAITGTALGGGLELCLATHYRVAVDNDKAQLGLPECKVGLLPGGGGTQRLTRFLGVMGSAETLLEGKPMSPKKAKAMGLVHEVVAKGEDLAAAKAWVKANAEEGRKVREKRAAGGKAEGSFEQPWDRKGFKIPGGGPYHPSGIQMFLGGNAMIRKNTYGLYEAQKEIMAAVYNGLQMPFDLALKVEARHFTKLMVGDQARNMIRTLFLSKQALEKGARRPEAVPPQPTKVLGMLGAGMMGAGIAYVSALVGIEVVLLDRDADAAARGKGYAEKLLTDRVKKGRMSQADADAVLARIRPTADYADLKDCDLIIEAVFEDPGIKKDVTERTEAAIPEGCIFGSNTSTLPITGLAKNSKRPAQFIGIHFFSPVDKMPLVEIIMGKETGPEALAKALDYVRQIRKTPIVVNDSRGFYTSRVFSTYVREGQIALAEGVTPALIENAGRMTGMPRGPLELTDDVALDLAHKVQKATRAALGEAYQVTPADALIEEMVETHQRFGRKNARGFYEYPEGGKKRLWPDLGTLKAVGPRLPEEEQPSAEDLKQRFLTIQALETARCFEEGVLEDVRDADVGAIFGWGFAPWTGGPLSYIDTVGLQEFVARCEALEKLHGPRFAPTPLLREMAEKGDRFYSRFAPAESDQQAA